MKIKIDIDVKPQEVRTLIGLPDVEGLQEDVVNYVRGKLASGADALEAVGLLKQFIPESVSAVSNLQKSILKSLGRFAGSEDDEEVSAEGSGGAKGKKASKSDTKVTKTDQSKSDTVGKPGAGDKKAVKSSATKQKGS